MTTLELSHIQKSVLHRHENLLVDRMEHFSIEDPTICNIVSHIQTNDKLGRTIFLKKHPNGKQAYSQQAILEMLAIGCIVLTGVTPEEAIVFYAGIANFQKESDAFLDEKVIGKVSKSSLKSGFLSTQIKAFGPSENLLTTAKISAYIQPIEEGAEQESTDDKQKKTMDIPAFESKPYQVKKPDSFKPSHMYMVDTILHNSDELIVGDYTFPSDHPLTRGHFPNNPVFMGILQWTMLEDICLGAIQQRLSEGNTHSSFTIKANGNVCKKDGTIAAEIKAINIEAQCVDDYIFIETTSFKKLLFRDIVRPNEPLLGVLTDIDVSQH